MLFVLSSFRPCVAKKEGRRGRVDGVKGVVPNTVTFTEKRPPCAGGDVQERSDESLERDGLTNKRTLSTRRHTTWSFGPK